MKNHEFRVVCDCIHVFSCVASYRPCEPKAFRVGDIVQLQLSFVAVRIKGGHMKLLTVLRSIALVDARFSKVSQELI